MFVLLCTAAALFASTNIDDLFVLVGFFADSRFQVREIVIGQYLGFATLVGVSVAASLSAMVLPRPYIGLLAVIPIGFGVKKLLDVFRERGGNEPDATMASVSKGHARTVAVAFVTAANGGDNISIYVPAFAVRSKREMGVIVIVFAVMTAAWCLLGHWIVNRPRLRTPIRRYGHIVTPVVLIALGITVIVQAGTLGFLQHSLFKR
jgi:cadmium resistance protein CadD (predicted permease)